MIFIPEKFSLKWETESLKSIDKGVSESQPLTNTPARFMHNTYGTHTCKFLVKWRNYAKRDLNLKCPNVQIGVLLEFQSWYICMQNYKRLVVLTVTGLEASKTENGRVSSQEINKRLL